MMFSGCIVAQVTPFKDGQVDFKKLDELVEFHLEQGTDCISPCGTTGESPTLSHEEHEAVIQTVVNKVDGKIKVLAGTGSNSTAEAIRLTHYAKKIGADGALMVSPYYNKPTQEGLYQHYKAVAEEVDIPIVLYNVPGRTGSSIAPKTVARLSKLKNIVAIKEASGSLDQASAIRALSDITLLSGDDALTLPIMSVGGQGVVSVVANIVPADVKAMVGAFKGGRTPEAEERHRRLFPLCRAMFIETNPIPVKTAMRILGRLNGELRLPLCPMQPAHEERLKEALKDYGLL
jgi:4-hydroxy-tetrahydrodipicolinate synthase